MDVNTRFYLWPTGPLGKAKIIVGLKVKPSLRRNAKIFSEPQSRISRNRTAAVHDTADPVGRNDDVPCKLIDADAHGFHEFLQKNFSWMDWVQLFDFCIHPFTSMIVNYFNLERFPIMPTKTNPPLVIDADAMLTLSIPF